MIAAESELRQFEQLWPALRDTVMRYGIPPSLLQELIEGVAMDGQRVRFDTWTTSISIPIMCFDGWTSLHAHLASGLIHCPKALPSIASWRFS